MTRLTCCQSAEGMNQVHRQDRWCAGCWLRASSHASDVTRKPLARWCRVRWSDLATSRGNWRSTLLPPVLHRNTRASKPKERLMNPLHEWLVRWRVWVQVQLPVRYTPLAKIVWLPEVLRPRSATSWARRLTQALRGAWAAAWKPTTSRQHRPASGRQSLATKPCSSTPGGNFADVQKPSRRNPAGDRMRSSMPSSSALDDLVKEQRIASGKRSTPKWDQRTTLSSSRTELTRSSTGSPPALSKSHGRASGRQHPVCLTERPAIAQR